MHTNTFPMSLYLYDINLYLLATCRSPQTKFSDKILIHFKGIYKSSMVNIAVMDNTKICIYHYKY